MLKDKIAIVTGAAHGIGQSITVEMLKAGAIVYACDILEKKMQENEKLKEENCYVKRVDVTDSKAIAMLVSEIIQRHGKIDILVNNAGGVAGQIAQPIEEVSNEQWRQIFAINLDGAFYFTREVAQHMKEKRAGSIINISSGAGRSYSLTGIQAYASSKAGLIGLTRQTARELGKHNIRVNCIAPGFIRSNPNSERQWQAMGKEGQDRVIQSLALRRLGEPEDIAYSTIFFASDYSKWITGQTISVDGGHWMLG